LLLGGICAKALADASGLPPDVDVATTIDGAMGPISLLEDRAFRAADDEPALT